MIVIVLGTTLQILLLVCKVSLCVGSSDVNSIDAMH